MSVLLPLAVFFALGVPIAFLLWRVFVVGGELRRGAQREREAADLAHRADLSLDELAPIVDDLRRGRLGPEVSTAGLAGCADALRRYAVEARGLARDRSGGGGGVLQAEIERAQRAVELIEHGRDLMLSATPDHLNEGETAIKRGYLNLLHARDALRAAGEELAAAAERSEAGDLGERTR